MRRINLPCLSSPSHDSVVEGNGKEHHNLEPFAFDHPYQLLYFLQREVQPFALLPHGEIIVELA